MRRLLALSVFFLALPLLHADNWPGWRGPTGQGFSSEKNLPLKWDAKTNIKWKIPLAEQGNSTPVIWGDRIYLTQANTGGTVRGVICFHRADGKELWKDSVTYDKKEQNWNPKWYCNASPTTDGERVLVSYGSAGWYCYDMDGKLMWKRTDLGHWQHSFGNASSPVIYKDLAILWCGPDSLPGKRNFLLAVNKKSGETVWQHEEKNGSWGTPVITKIQGHDQMLLAMGEFLKAFDPHSGKELWRCDGLMDYVYTSPLYENGYAVAMSGYGKSAIGLKVDGTGDISKERLWRHPKNIQRVGSGILIGEHCYIVDENGMPRCYEVKTGEEVWKVQDRINSNTWGSMVHAEGRLYVMMRNSETVVFNASPKYEILAVNPLGKEETNSSPAISNGEIFLRTFKHLFCVSEKK